MSNLPNRLFAVVQVDITDAEQMIVAAVSCVGDFGSLDDLPCIFAPIKSPVQP